MSVAIPPISFGTYKVGIVPAGATTPAQGGGLDECIQVIGDAVKAGYRSFDCASFYANEAMLGEALQKTNIPRSELFLTSKVWNTAIFEGEEAIKQQFEETLKNLRTDYLDLYLLHWPVPGKFVAAWKVLEQLVSTGKVRAIGLSNFTIENFNELENHITIKPAVNQMEVSPMLYRKKTIDFFASKGIPTQGYRVIQQGTAVDDATLLKIAQKHSCLSTQVMLAWCLAKGMFAVVKSSNPSRMSQNLDVSHIHLDEEDISTLDNLTQPQAFDNFEKTYLKSVVRFTPLESDTLPEIVFTKN